MNLPLFTLSFALFTAAWLYFLQARVIMLRRGNKIAFGDGDNKALRGWIRAHANALENLLPFTMLALIYELVFGSGIVLAVFMLAMAAARVAHPWGLIAPRKFMSTRVIGMAATLAVSGLFILWTLVRLLAKLFA
mgnify:CR=1 FL=1